MERKRNASIPPITEKDALGMQFEAMLARLEQELLKERPELFEK